MISLTENELKVLNFLLRNFNERHSINKLGKILKLSPGGIYKILKKLESLNILLPERIGNAVYYHINFESGLGIAIARLVLASKEMNTECKVLYKDLQPLKNLTECAILFGSVVEKGEKARDIDILLVFKKKNYKKVMNSLKKIQEIKTKKIHEMIQTKKELILNIKKKNKPLLDAIKKGIVLWGEEFLVEAIKNGTNRNNI